jgi:hypothetical protein
MSESGKPLREQMTEAMEKIREQVDILRSGPNIGGPLDNRSVIADLEAEYLALKVARTNIDPGDR